ncbi:MAG TPA: hypothetical protein VML19_20980 [Verrucomicrobiae bacterium]|nr:hypothetical protein [Verrucomicrobiae bacterium]
MLLVDFIGFLIVSVAIDSAVETVVVKSIESPLQPVQLGLIATQRLVTSGLFGQVTRQQFVL